MKNFLKFIGISLVILIHGACSKDGVNRGLKGWYVDLSRIATEADFKEINDAIDNNDLVYHGYISGDVYAQDLEFFSDDGRWSTHDNKYGTLRFLPENRQVTVWKIVDNKTIVRYIGDLMNPKYVNSNGTILAKTYTGKHFGELWYVDMNGGIYYTYTRDGNKLYVNDYDEYGMTIFTIIDGGLREDGSSRLLSKYDPNKSY